MTVNLSALRKRAVVRVPPDTAFALFTEHLGAWWPLDTHSVGLDDAVGVVFEPGVGGRIVEAIAGGATSVWGTVDVWEPPARVRFSWHPGTPPDEATQVEVTFAESADGGTLVELVHSGWDRRPDGAAARASYGPGWDFVFGRFAAAGQGSLTPATAPSYRRS
jgi:uncharacterized protein YndB with AHSA1/START domain